jgi:hypothetical protein
MSVVPPPSVACRGAYSLARLTSQDELHREAASEAAYIK